jgi:regulator of replication initiation timing
LEDKINNLNNTIRQLKQENTNIMKKYEEANNKIKQLTLENNNLKNKINQLENIINDKNKEIQDNIFKINNLSGNNNNQIIFNPGDKILDVLFMSQGNQDIVNYTIPCKSTDLFVRLEERLYNDYPKYRNYETFFMVNTRRILRFKTLEENKIKSGDIISLFTNE